jgi:hypothetical protein
MVVYELLVSKAVLLLTFKIKKRLKEIHSDLIKNQSSVFMIIVSSFK